jgi:hypothetical protein
MWYTGHTARYYELQEQQLENINVNIIWIKPAIIYSPLIILGISGTIPEL